MGLSTGLQQAAERQAARPANEGGVYTGEAVEAGWAGGGGQEAGGGAGVAINRWRECA